MQYGWTFARQAKLEFEIIALSDTIRKLEERLGKDDLLLPQLRRKLEGMQEEERRRQGRVAGRPMLLEFMAPPSPAPPDEGSLAEAPTQFRLLRVESPDGGRVPVSLSETRQAEPPFSTRGSVSELRLEPIDDDPAPTGSGAPVSNTTTRGQMLATPAAPAPDLRLEPVEDRRRQPTSAPSPAPVTMDEKIVRLRPVVCLTCKRRGRAVYRRAGSNLLEALFWLSGVLPGLFYRISRRKRFEPPRCAYCGSGQVVPAHCADERERWLQAA